MPDGDPLPMERKALVLDLAKRGHEQAMRSWRAFERDDPLSAAAVVKHASGTLTKTARPAAGVTDPEAVTRAVLRANLLSDDPGLRETSRSALYRLEGAR